jgi:hypothetical protein
MTAKQAIKVRCKDCLAGNRECAFADCALKGLAGEKGRCDRTTAIRKYCQWCMNGNPVNQCASPDCAIYQYRAAYEGGALKVRFLPPKTPIKGGAGLSK